MTEDPKTHESVAVIELRVQVGILGERVFGIDKNLGARIESLGVKFDAFTQELKSSYATKTDLSAVDDRIRKVQDNQAWVVKLIVGAIIVTALSLLIAHGGVPHS